MLKSKKCVKLISELVVLALMLMMSNSLGVSAADSNSVYLSLASDYTVTTTTTILTTTFSTYAATTKLYVQSDGRYYSSSNICAGMQIKVDTSYVGNCSVVDWRGTTSKAQHSYDCIAGVTVGPGSHTFNLVAQVLSGSGSFIVGAASNLSIMNNVTVDMKYTSLATDSQSFNFTTYGIRPGTPAPHTPVLSIGVNNSSGPIIALGSGRAYKNNAEGDSMFGLYEDGSSLPNNQANWSTNDIYSAAELQAPLYSHAYINATGSHTISMDATELPWMPSSGENPVQYSVGADSTLVVMDGSQQVCGAGSSLNSDTNNDEDYTWIGDGSGSGQTIQLSSGTVTVPSGHNGVVMFDSKIKMQPAGDSTTSGNVSLWIEIDGVQCGSIGVQGIVAPNNISERTLSASYLAAGSKALSVGTHTVTVKIKTQGSPCWALNELPLLWFDGQSSSSGVNLITNASFESGLSSWTIGGYNPTACYTQSPGITGADCMVHWATTAYNVYTFESLTGLTNGLYTMKAWVESGGGLGSGYMCVSNYGGSEIDCNIPTISTWYQITIPNINVTNATCTAGFYSNSPANSWYLVDDVQFYKQ